MTSAQTVVRGQEWWMGREARNSQKLRACSPAVSPHHAPALPRDAPPKNRENRENRTDTEDRGPARAGARVGYVLEI